MKTYCDSEGTREGEEFGCLLEVGHLGEHLGPTYYGPPCPMCHWLEEHDADCMLWYLMEDRRLPLQQIAWVDDGAAYLRPYQRPADRCPHCAGTGQVMHRDRSGGER